MKSDATQDVLLRRIVLGYLADLQSIPQTFGEVSAYAQSRLRRACEVEAREAIDTLETLGYLARAEATAADEPLWKITASGLRQALRRVPPKELDPMIWGTA